MKKSIVVATCLACLASISIAAPFVTGVTAKQRYPWNGLVDITVTLSGTEEECTAAAFPFYVTNKTTRAELPIGSVKAVGAIAGAGNTWTRRFIWNATADVGCSKFGEVELTVGAQVTDGVQLWENGPYWAECNVGASQPEEAGYYFWWGDTIGYVRNSSNDGWVSADGNGVAIVFGENNYPANSTTKRNNDWLKENGWIDDTGNLVAAHDAATTHLGFLWRMPTYAEFLALKNNCDVEWTSRNGVFGQLVKGRGAYAAKNIFIPAAGLGFLDYLYNFGSEGFYWCPSPNMDSYTPFLRLSSFSLNGSGSDRYKGYPVRPVRGVAQ